MTFNGSRSTLKNRPGAKYGLITYDELVARAKGPTAFPKLEAPAIIPSSYNAHDGRTHAMQRQRGQFWLLCADVDKDSPSRETLKAAVIKVVGSVAMLIYSSSSATSDNLKWRVIIPLATPIEGEDFKQIADACYDLLGEQGIECDYSLARSAQPVFLPNVPPDKRGDDGNPKFYQFEIIEGHPLDITTTGILRHRDATRAAAEVADRERRAEIEQRRTTRRTNSITANDSLIDAFNTANCVDDMLTAYGYKYGGNDNWRSPLQEGQTFATRVYEDKWFSLSTSDASIGQPASSGSGRWGDAFDLYVYFVHHGDVKSAFRTLGAQQRAAQDELWAQQAAEIDWGEGEDGVIDEIRPRTHEELLAAVADLRMDTDPAVVEKIIVDTGQLGEVRRDAIFRAIKARTSIPLAVMRKQLSSQRKGSDLDHLDLANRTLDEVGRGNVICVEAGTWGWQQCGVWKLLNDRTIKQRIQSILKDIELSVDAPLVNGVTDVLKNAIFQKEHTFNLGNTESVNCRNGELELIKDAWRLGPHIKGNYRTTQIPVVFDAKATAPRFTTFLDEVFRDDPDKMDKVQSLLELMGYTLMSHARHEKFVILIGAGANGKSVLLTVLEAMCGLENVAGVQPCNFDNKFQRGYLDQKLANIITELKQGEVIADAELKSITSGEPTTVEKKFQHPFTMHPFCTVWIGTNHMPHTRDFSEALFRRATILTFNRTFAVEEQDPQLKESLRGELPGILNMVLVAYAGALENGFTEPPSSQAAKGEWRLEADQVAQFVEACCVRDPSCSEKSGTLYKGYKIWAEEEGIHKVVSQRGFRERLTRLGFGANRDAHHRYVVGLTYTPSTIRWGAAPDL